MILDILETPINFIKENLTGWVLLILIVIIIYFVGLRNYYIQKERFYNQSLEEQENTELKKDDTNQETDIEKETVKAGKTKARKSNVVNATKVAKSDKAKAENNIEGFQNTTQSPNKISSNVSSYVATTLFDNLNLSTPQLQNIKMKYNNVIAQYVIDLGKLVQQQRKNRFLNTQKQFDIIIAKGIDTIINYLNDTIKSYNVLTRTSIRTEIFNTLIDVLELLIAKTNNDITTQSNQLAIQNSTTIDYTTQLKDITTLRTQLDEYFEINKLVSNYGRKVSVSDKEISSILDKSYILPIYEQNYNKIQQLVNSDFNGDENNLADKYSKAYMDFLEEKKKEELNINPMILASQIESGLVSLITGKTPSTKEQYETVIDNPIPPTEKKLIDNTLLNNTLLNNANIIRDSGNRGNYLIDKPTQNNILEGFETNPDTNTNIAKAITNTINNASTSGVNSKKTNGNNTDILSGLMSGNFLQYVMDFINEKLRWFMQYYNYRMDDGKTTNASGNNFILEDNMIPAGFLLFVLSMLIYFIDTTS